jgi:hypothetical protein
MEDIAEAEAMLLGDVLGHIDGGTSSGRRGPEPVRY